MGLFFQEVTIPVLMWEVGAYFFPFDVPLWAFCRIIVWNWDVDEEFLSLIWKLQCVNQPNLNLAVVLNLGSLSTVAFPDGAGWGGLCWCSDDSPQATSFETLSARQTQLFRKLHSISLLWNNSGLGMKQPLMLAIMSVLEATRNLPDLLGPLEITQ